MQTKSKNCLAHKLMKEADIADIVFNNPTYFGVKDFQKEEIIDFLHEYFTINTPKLIPRKLDNLSWEIIELCSAKHHDNAENIKNLLIEYLETLVQFKKSFPKVKLFLCHEPPVFLNTILENKHFASKLDDKSLTIFKNYSGQLKQKKHLA